eukprot:TRINITY_DN22969_c0_g1_i1.p1 TRINITY_DN22969_c0_g1~~TRINITY_DN22969_c0_g1_i1.p1  ORF type:complete len:465 (+),score=92.47 TRINITY_DN22969_c0_g1_i1:69-1463(+)
MKTLLTLLLVAQLCVAEHIVVSLESNRPWKYLGAFVFEKHQGFPNDDGLRGKRILPEINWAHDADDLEIRFYYNGDNGEPWSSASKWFKIGDDAPDSDLETISKACENSRTDAGIHPQSVASSVPIYDKRRDREWHFVAVKKNCYFASPEDVAIPQEAGDISVQFHNPGGFFTYEFGVNKYHILQTLMVCTLLVFLLFIIYTVKRFQVSLHPIAKFFNYTCTVQLISFILYTSSYFAMASTGEAHRNIMLYMGRIADVAGDTMFLLLVIVFAMGFKVLNLPGVATAADSETVQKRRHSLLLFLCVVSALRIALVSVEVHEGIWNNTSPYKSLPGVLLAVLRIPIFIYYIYSLCGTIKRSAESANKTFFLTWGVIFSASIIGLPIYVFLAEVVSPWVEYRVVFCSDTSVKTILMIAMGVILMPGERSEALLGSGYTPIPVMSDQIAGEDDAEIEDIIIDLGDEQL